MENRLQSLCRLRDVPFENKSAAVVEIRDHSQMGKSDDWDNWYSEFAEWPPKVQSLLDEKPELKLGEHVWIVCHRTMEVSSLAIARFVLAAEKDVPWLISALQHGRQRWFVARMATLARSIPEALFEPMLIAAVGTEPEYLRLFIDPCVRTFGAERVKEYLVPLTESTDLRRVIGALCNLRWIEHDPDAFVDVFDRRKTFFLEGVVSESSADLQSYVLTWLKLDEQLYPETHQPLVARAREIRDMLRGSSDPQ